MITIKLTPEQHEYLTMICETRALLVDQIIKEASVGKRPQKMTLLEKETKTIDSILLLLDKGVK